MEKQTISPFSSISWLVILIPFLLKGMIRVPVQGSSVNNSQYHVAVKDSVPNLQNGLAKTPPMGWNSWYAFSTHINEKQIKTIADDMVVNGMKAAGYKYINLDDGWMASTRDSRGRLRADPKRFPDGIKALADYVHSLGLKFGIYESAGIKTCAGYPGSLYHEKQDAETFAQWGVDYLKLDNCYNQGVSYIKRYAGMQRDLLATGRPIVFSICEWGFKDPWQWAPKISNLWRTTGDISDNWNRVMSTVDQEVGLYKYAGPGHWNNPCMLQAGNGGMTTTEYKTQFSLWAILAAPLIASTDLRHITESTLKIFENRDVIAVDQDPAGIQGHKVMDTGNQEVWVRPLSDGSSAVLLLNRGSQKAFMTITAERAGLNKAAYYKEKNLWSHKFMTNTKDLIRANVPPHGVVLFRLWPELR